MADNTIVAIELGSSKITGIAGKKNLDGSITVLAVVTDNNTNCIRKGVVYNIDKTAQCLTGIVGKLRTQLKHEISQVYVGIGGQSVRSVKNVVPRELPSDTIISDAHIDLLQDANRSMDYPEQEILGVATQEFKVDNQFTVDPVGIKASHLEGNFLNILCRKAFYNNLYACFKKANINIAETYFAPRTLADCVLTEAERRGGCVLVDLGADTTTVSVYYKNILRHIAVIPLGGSNITKDIASLQMEEKDAEQMKLQYASAYTETSEIDGNKTYPIDGDRSVESKVFVDIVESRLNEIIENVWYQVPSQYADKLLGGIILTGGGSRMKNIEKAFRINTHTEKVRRASFVTPTITFNSPTKDPKDGSLYVVLSLLAKGDMGCTGSALNSDLFGSEPKKTPDSKPATTETPQRTKDSGTGDKVLTPEEKEAIEEKKRQAKAEEQRKEREAEEQRRKEEEEKRRNSPINRFGRWMKGKLGGLMDPDDAE